MPNHDEPLNPNRLGQPMLRGLLNRSILTRRSNLQRIALIVAVGVGAGLIACLYFGMKRIHYPDIDTIPSAEERLKVYSELVSSIQRENITTLELVLCAFDPEYSPETIDGSGILSAKFDDEVSGVTMECSLQISTAWISNSIFWGNIVFTGDRKVLASIRDTFIRKSEARCGAGDRLLYSVGDTPLPLIVWAEDVAILCAESRIEIVVGSEIESKIYWSRAGAASEIEQAYRKIGLSR
jgi:hypothetical protein